RAKGDTLWSQAQRWGRCQCDYTVPHSPFPLNYQKARERERERESEREREREEREGERERERERECAVCDLVLKQNTLPWWSCYNTFGVKSLDLTHTTHNHTLHTFAHFEQKPNKTQKPIKNP